MAKYRKRPVVIEAYQTDKELDMFRIVAEHFRFNNGIL